MRAIILAAGKGTRMQSELPKVLFPLLEKPLIIHVIENIRKAGVEEITAVVGYKGEQVASAVDSSVEIVWQREQLGTGHAVIQAEENFKSYDGRVVVACGDAPLISGESFSKLIAEMNKSEVKASVLTMIQENPKGYGRMVKDSKGSLLKIVEEKDASEEEKKIQEVNTGTYVFDSKLLFEGLKNIGNKNAQGEYYLTDVLEYIISRGHKVTTMPLENAFEGSGINSRDDHAKVEEYLKSRK